MREILLTQGYVAVVDDEDYERLNVWKWKALRSHGHVYACRSYSPNGRKGPHFTILMHREVLGCPDGLVVDHIDRDGLNDTRANLRACSHSENRRNQIGNAAVRRSRYKGVDFHKASGLWRARVKLHGRVTSLGYHHTEEDAARAYDTAAAGMHGAFARLNFPTPQEFPAAL